MLAQHQQAQVQAGANFRAPPAAFPHLKPSDHQSPPMKVEFLKRNGGKVDYKRKVVWNNHKIKSTIKYTNISDLPIVLPTNPPKRTNLPHVQEQIEEQKPEEAQKEGASVIFNMEYWLSNSTWLFESSH